MNAPRTRRRYVPAVGPKLRKLLYAVFGLFALLAINAVYLVAISLLEWTTGNTYQDYFYQYMFLVHLVLGFAIIVPIIVYGAIHIKNAHNRPNRRAVKAGYALFTVSLVLLATGLVLTRGIPLIEVRAGGARDTAYWVHVIAPLVVGWLFVLHRLAGVRINWRAGGLVAAVAVALAGVAMVFQYQDPRRWNEAGPASGLQYFFPSLARTATGNFIPAQNLMRDDYCAECHADVHETWSHSMHRFASFNNPAYLFSVRNTRQFSLERDGTVQAARFCAGCHDPVPFFSGAFDDPEFDDVNHPTSQAGITCTACHAITHVNSVRGNADYTIEEPLHYPFVDSDNTLLQWTNRFLVKAKPEFHRRSFLKPLHKSGEFCGTCHKVHLPEELNGYKWLRGQNHYDAWLLSGVSGHGVTSFYYPDAPQRNCNGCHMPLAASDDFGARDFDATGERKVHDHQFPSANTAIPYLLKMPATVIEKHREFLEDSLRVDIFGLRRGGTIDGELIAPLGDDLPVLTPGETYLLEVVVRTLTLGHLFTQGTADSNEVWVDVGVDSDGATAGRSGGLSPADGSVDPFAHFINAYVIDRDGNRIDRRNAEDIFTALYNHQIPPGAADVLHYRFTVPAEAQRQIGVSVGLNYRKFDTTYMRHFQGEAFDGNDLPIVTIATDMLRFPVGAGGRPDEASSGGDRGLVAAGRPSHTIGGRAAGRSGVPPRQEQTSSPDGVAGMSGSGVPSRQDIPLWQRWNDYGIGLLRKGGAGQLRQAEAAFSKVEQLGRGDGALNLARVYLREGRLDEAVDALNLAGTHSPPAYPWSIAWFTALVNKQNGYLEQATEGFESLVNTQFVEARGRGFDFSRDYRLLNELADTYFERAKLARGPQRQAERDGLLGKSRDYFEAALKIDPENAAAHYGLAQVHATLGNDDRATEHRALHARYKPDDNARDRAIALARRRDAAANHAADAVVIYDLQPPADEQLSSKMNDHAPGQSPGPEPEQDEIQDDAIIGRAFRWSALAIAAAGVVAAGIWFVLTREPPAEVIDEATQQTARTATESVITEPPDVTFTDITTQAGIDFVHVNGAYGERLLPETMGSGVAFFDFDNDGDQDLLFVNAASWPWVEPQATTAALYRNDGSGRFDNVTSGSGLDVPLYGQGVAIADIDADGLRDVFIAAVGENRLFRNIGDGRFQEIAQGAGAAGAPQDWSTSAAFLDYDNDGDLDLFVANYVQWSREIDFEVDYQLTGIGRAYGPPTNYGGTNSRLYRNDSGRFVDVSEEAGILVNNPATGLPMGKGLAVTTLDYDNDGHTDLLVANDTVQNFLFRNLGSGAFEEIGAVAGVAYDNSGAATGAMGIDAAWYNNDDDIAVAIGNFANEMTSFYVAQGGSGLFTDEAIGSGIGPDSRRALSFGVFFFDYDLDGRLDALQTNGHVENEINTVQPSQHYEQPTQLFWNCGLDCPRIFVNVTDAGDLHAPVVGRGAAYGDIDADGDLDVVVTQTGRGPLLLRNDQQTGHHWLRLQLQGEAPNSDAIGAVVEVETPAGIQRQRVAPSRSYLSQVELPLTFGLGDDPTVLAVRVRWPDSTVTKPPVPAPNVPVTIEKPGIM